MSALSLQMESTDSIALYTSTLNRFHKSSFKSV